MSTSTVLSLSAEDVRDRFRRFATAWKKESRHLSNTAQMAMLPSYQRIIGLGLPAVPLILQELQVEPNQWFWALESITDENPVRPENRGKVRLMAQDWLEWGRQHGYLTP
jgi:hypothetical protein